MSKYNIFIADFFAEEMKRGAELCNNALLSYFPIKDISFYFRCDQYNSSNKIDYKDNCKYFTIISDNTYIISNFVNLPEEAKQKLIEYKNYIIYEHDHKYTPTRNPFINPDGTRNKDGIVPKKFRINQEFYKNAKVVLCQTKWHQEQLAKNLDCTLDNIGGSFYTNEDLDILSNLASTKKKDRYSIFNDSEIIYLPNGQAYKQGKNIKNKNEAIQYCIDNKFKYIFIPRINDTNKFWKTMGSFKHFVFFPDIPETCSRLLIEAKMLGCNVITNDNSGASHEDWFNLNGQELIDHFKNTMIPNAIKKFRSYL